MCEGILKAMTAGGFAGILLSVAEVLPEAAFFYAVSVLFRQTALKGKDV